jgi:hypothetical protein
VLHRRRNRCNRARLVLFLEEVLQEVPWRAQNDGQGTLADGVGKEVLAIKSYQVGGMAVSGTCQHVSIFGLDQLGGLLQRARGGE